MDKFSPNELYLEITYKCNLRCDHCCREYFDVSMTHEIARKAITQGKEIGIEVLSLTGGEPFTNFEVLIDAVKLAAENAIKTEDIATNGGWWRDSKDLLNKLNTLKDCGYCGLIHVSIDIFHKVPSAKLAEFIKTVIAVFGRSGIIMISSRETDQIKALPKLEEVAHSLDGKFIRKDVHRGVIESPLGDIFCWIEDVCHIGRAEMLGVGDHKQWFTEAPCGKMNRTIVVNPFGDVEICLGYISNKNRDMVIGNINESSLKEIVANFSSCEIAYSIFENKGPLGLRDAIEKHDPIIIPHPFSNPCEFCNFLFSDKKARQTLKDLGFLKKEL